MTVNLPVCVLHPICLQFDGIFLHRQQTDFFDAILSGIVLMYIKNSTGPITEPWGIQLFTGCYENLESLNTILCCRPERKSVIQFKVLPVNPYCLRTPISLLCGTESKTFLKSK